MNTHILLQSPINSNSLTLLYTLVNILSPITEIASMQKAAGSVFEYTDAAVAHIFPFLSPVAGRAYHQDLACVQPGISPSEIARGAATEGHGFLAAAVSAGFHGNDSGNALGSDGNRSVTGRRLASAVDTRGRSTTIFFFAQPPAGPTPRCAA